MIVYAAADFHGQLFDVPADADLALLAGDVCPDFRPVGKRASVRYGSVDKGGTQQGHWLRSEFVPWVQRQPCPILMTWGNHDFVGEHRFLVPESMPPVLLDLGYICKGVSVYGTATVPGLPYWAFYGDDHALALRAVSIPHGVDVLMTHGPPLKAGDYIPGGTPKQVSKYGNLDGMHVGDPYLTEAIKRTRPRVVICGHIHEDRGAHEVDGVPVYNVAAVDGDYEPYGQPWTRLFEFDALY